VLNHYQARKPRGSPQNSVIAALNPENVVLVCGENDLSDDDVETTFERYQNVVNKYLQSSVRVVSISTKPEPGTMELHEEYEEVRRVMVPTDAPHHWPRT